MLSCVILQRNASSCVFHLMYIYRFYHGHCKNVMITGHGWLLLTPEPVFHCDAMDAAAVAATLIMLSYIEKSYNWLRNSFRNLNERWIGMNESIGYSDRSAIWRTSCQCYQLFANRMAWQWAETLVEIRGTLADIRGTTKLGCRWNFPKHEFNRPVCLEAHHYLLAHLSQ